MNPLLTKKSIVIIGGTSGIGLSVLKAFVENGAKVIAMGLPQEDLPEIKGCVFTFGDARSEAQVENSIRLCVANFGDFDGLFHVAGGSGRKWGDGPLHEISLEAWNNTMELNLTSVMLSNRAAIRYFLEKKKGGSILNTSSLLAYRPNAKFFYTHAYTAAKAGIIGFSKAISAYYAEYNIRVNVLAPGLTDTPMAKRAAGRDDIQEFIKTKQPLDGGRMATASDMVGAACYFLSDDSNFTTGQVLGIDGGWSVSEGQYQ